MSEFLMCPPDYYNIDYEINTWMDINKEPDKKLAEEQWFKFYYDVFDKYKNFKNCHFINYESLHDIDYSVQFLKILGLNKYPNYQFKISQKEINDRFDKDLYLNAEELFKLLQT